MTSIAERPRMAVATGTLSIKGFWISLALCLALVAGVGGALVDAPASTRDIALPVLILGATLMFGLGLADLARARELRFARALIVAGVLWSLSALTASDDPLRSSVGHVSQWFVVLAIVYVLLGYPSGQLANRTDRALFAGGALLLAVLYLPTALAAQQFPHPSLWSDCVSACPRNAFSLAHSTPAVVRDILIPSREVLTVSLFAAIAVTVIRRARNAGPLLARLYAPIAAFAAFQTVLFAAYFALRTAAPDSRAVSTMGWMFVLTLPAAGLACGTGRLYRHIYAANALDRIARTVRAGSSAVQVRRALSDALEDPSLRILHSSGGDSKAWVDDSGSPVSHADGDRAGVTEIAGDTQRIAIVHDPSLAEDRFLVQIAGSYALAALENDRLTGELHSSREELAESRTGRLVAEQSTRQKIERDLHDGAQQRLVALRVKLELAASALEAEDPEQARVIRALGDEVDATIDEVRAFARGVYPSLLAQTGLEQALRGASRDAPLPATVYARGLGRYPADLEATLYFSCLEALQNACKHARSATGVTISVWQDSRLHFEVSDDGDGFDLQTTPYGTGLTNLGDRLSAAGGTMTIRSTPGQGTILAGSIPLG